VQMVVRIKKELSLFSQLFFWEIGAFA